MPVLDATDLHRTLGERRLLDGVSLTIRRGEKIGLVGHNGSGKSTLARVLAGLEEPESGRIALRRGARVAYLEQEPCFEPGRSVREVVLESLVEWNATRSRYEALTDALAGSRDAAEQARLAAEQAELAEAIERLGGWERAHEAEATAGHLGIHDAERSADALSGGEARRVALARLLVSAPDLAILDEPTNHLDLETIEWVEVHLRDRFPGALLLISHDRGVLDAVTTRTLEIHDGQVDAYEGGYAQYLIAKAEREAHAERTWRNTRNFLRREVEWLRRQPKARGTKQKARVARAESALDQRAPQQERQADLRASASRQGKTILELDGLAIERDGRRLVEDLTLALKPGDRFGVVGPNGSGKTSLLLAIQERLEPSAGRIVQGANTRIGYLDQARAELDPADTVREAAVGDASEVVLGDERLSVGSYLERFLFDHRQQRVKVAELSGGERARVCLARLLSRRCNLLLLDEPTNDLDVMTLSALEAMLLDYGGSLLVVSHDRWLLDRVTTGILAFEGDGRVEVHAGDFSAYRARRAAAEAETGGAAPSASAGSASTARGAASPVATADVVEAKPPKRLSQAERRELDGLFARIETAEERVAALQARLADPETYRREGEGGGAGDGVAALREELAVAEAEAATLVARWEELEARSVAS